ncbi:hypothetical protein GWK47_013883 [Chionoecetes opilio]|uniref:Uncharacterized protein n=1 Tax=Chionoecetes opilio TaxID=41210 RepID=A0A8J4XTQ0_CHIOP|nr:hypothetical protein GWK47_002911 [Chionoecetes opilio]KAG0714563.1 hypothetical protein GWK47_013883 [Chionoecetes opilio]
MVQNVRRHVAMRDQKSVLVSLSGKDMEDVVKEVRKQVEGVQEGMVILQEGGNNLRRSGSEQTVGKMMECLKYIKKDRKKLRVAVVGIMRRPRENAGYEEMRRDTNKRLQEEVVKMNQVPGDYEVSFIDLDGALPQEVFERDGVHLN